MNKPKIHGEQLQCWLVCLYVQRVGEDSGVGCDWCCDHSNIYLLATVRLLTLAS